MLHAQTPLPMCFRTWPWISTESCAHTNMRSSSRQKDVLPHGGYMRILMKWCLFYEVFDVCICLTSHHTYSMDITEVRFHTCPLYSKCILQVLVELRPHIVNEFDNTCECSSASCYQYVYVYLPYC